MVERGWEATPYGTVLELPMLDNRAYLKLSSEHFTDFAYGTILITAITDATVGLPWTGDTLR